MSYKVLARKWRPHHFNDMIGQEHVLRALVNALDSDRLHHAYLFTGMRGVGKTTIARIFAKCLNCETNGVSANPCGECSTCQDIDAGRFFDLIEVDAASRTKVEETRELLENVPYAPTSGRFKVYLIDEVHMFSTHSFNALLKTLEEPPEHVKFLLATTDPQKVPVTVLSRCLQFNLKSMPPSRLSDYLAKILDAESIEHERPALDLIARASEGSVRDSLSLVEQAAAFGMGKVQALEVESMLGRVSTERLTNLLTQLCHNDAVELFKVVDSMDEYSPDYTQVLGELVSLLHQIALLQMVPESVNQDVPSFEALTTLAKNMQADEVQLYYQIGLHARRDMPFAPDAREAFDMALLRMLAFAPQVGAESTATKAGSATIQTKPAAGESKKNNENLSESAAAVVKPVTEKPTPPVKQRTPAAPAPVAQASCSAPAPAKPTQATPVKSAAKTVEESPVPKDEPVAPVIEPEPPARLGEGEQLSADNWAEHVARLGLAGMPRQLANNCALIGETDGTLSLKIDANNEHLNTPRFSARLQTALCEYTGRSLHLNIQLSDETLDTPAIRTQISEAEALKLAKASIDADPLVQQLVKKVDAVVDSDSVQPLGEPEH